MLHTRRFSALLATAALAFLAPRAAGQIWPQGFVAEPIGSGWASPVGLCFIDANRLLVAERDGRIWYVENDVKRNLVYDIASETLTNGDRGMLGITVPPDFDQTGWLYLLFVVDIGGSDRAALAFSRLIRVRTEYSGGDLVAQPASREYLLGDTWSTGITSCHLSHTIGSLRFLSDGSLVLTSGDNAHYDGLDGGNRDMACFATGRTPLDQDLGSFRSQYDNTLCGKVLRLDPETGQGLADNPFFTGDPDALLSRVYARGLRNPFRFTLLPDSGPREALLISDVGWDNWEEINLALGGENFGWPCYEGNAEQAGYQGIDARGICASAASEHRRPLLAWHHTQNTAGFRGNCASGICIYTGTRYPEVYRQRLFFCDFGRNWMRAAELDEHLNIENSIAFGRDLLGPVDLVAQPDTGDLVLCMISSGVFRLRYVGSGIPPRAAASATPAFGPGDLDALLSAADSSDAEGQDLTYAWRIGGAPVSDAREFQHLFTGKDPYLVSLTVTDTEGLADTTELLVSPNNTPPSINELLAPGANATYEPDAPLRFAALASDPEDGQPQATWTLDLVHDHHTHPNWDNGSGLDVVLTPNSEGSGDNHFVVHLGVADQQGLSAEHSFEIFDRTSQPQAHLSEIADTHVRVGQVLRPLGHVDYSYGRVTVKQPRLVWSWGDGTSDVFPDAHHQVETAPTHIYRSPGRYLLKLVAELDGRQTAQSVVIEVAPARPSVAIFAPLNAERWVPRAQQEEIVARLTADLTQRASEVRAFNLGAGANLAAWMESLLDDGLSDVLVLLDFMPSALVVDGIEGSLLQRWVQSGNGLVWSGMQPFLTALNDDGTAALSVLGAETFFGSQAVSLVQGVGVQTSSPLGLLVLPSFVSYRSERALRYDALAGTSWQAARVFAEDGDHDSDALEVQHTSRGFYTQLLCDPDSTLPRAAVLSEYLRDKLGKARSANPFAPTPR